MVRYHLSCHQSSLAGYALKHYDHNDKFLHGNKHQCRFVRDATRLFTFKEHQAEKFFPTDPINVESDFLMKELGLFLANSMQAKLRNKREDSHNHLTSFCGVFSWVMVTEAEN